ncbi:MAG: RNase adapter RapZ [Lachnospiraceae bacterium]|nr:RNase adapter RapZ [Lachnospiraceae bacterium]
MRFVIVTGMSGGGRATALRMLEDAGYYCVDNLPIPLIPGLMELLDQPGSEYTKVALGLDVRAGLNSSDTMEMLDNLKKAGRNFEILFMNASDEVLVKRYKESRRNHPMTTQDDRLEDGIRREREVLSGILSKADYVIDTSNLLTRELKVELDRIFIDNEDYNSLIVSILSFGFKNGVPQDADLVFDVRFLPNPFYIDELKTKTGLDQEVKDYVLSFPEAGEFVDKIVDLLDFLIPNYVREGKYKLVVAVGCTGGKHRSVTLADQLYKRMRGRGQYGLTLSHRDVTRAGK